MNTKNVIIVTEEDRNIVQSADIACSAHRDIITFILSNNIDIPAERFQAYQAEYEKKFSAFEQAKEDLQQKYLAGIPAINWNLEYATCELTYNV